MLNHHYDYQTNLEASLRINWRIEDVIGGRQFDYSKPFLPDSLAGVKGIRCLNAKEKLKLNQIRGYTYLYTFGLVEEYILPSVVEHTETAVHGDDYEIRALLRFAEEEAKHIQLFKWFVREFEKGFGTPCATIGPAKDIAAAILKHSRLGVFVTTLHIEWMSQRHYVDSVKGNPDLDPLFCSLLKHHWLEEAQHAKLDALIIDKIASSLTSEEIESAVQDYMSIGKLLDDGLAAQVQLDLASLSKAIGRTLSDSEKAEIAQAQIQAYRWTFLVSGMTHPNFDRTLRELTESGLADVSSLARAMMVPN
jgi:hypothetical protein